MPETGCDQGVRRDETGACVESRVGAWLVGLFLEREDEGAFGEFYGGVVVVHVTSVC